MTRVSIRPEAPRYQLNRRRLLASSVGGAGASALLAACGSRTSSGKPASGAQASQPRYGGQINLATSREPFDFDPTTREQDNRLIFVMAYDSLLSLKATPEVSYNDIALLPGLADRWETPDAQTFTFHLHPGATFANAAPVNGRAATSADVKWSMEYLSRTGQFKGVKGLPPALNASTFKGMSGVETPDNNTVVIHFDAPYVPFLNYMAAEFTPILAHEIYDQDGNFSSRAVGTGPWQLDMPDTQKGARWVFKKNPTYFKSGRPYIDQVNWLVLLDDATQQAAFTSKQVAMFPGDHGGSPDYKTAQVIKQNNPDAVMDSYLDTSGNILYWNVRKAPLSDQRIRRAIALCLDRDASINSVLEGQGQWALAGGIPGLFTQDEIKKLLPHDPAQAKQLVSQAGFPNGVDLQFMLQSDSAEQVSVTQLLQQQLKQGNINTTIQTVDSATSSKRRASGDFQLNFLTKRVNGDIDAYLVGDFLSSSAHNYIGVNDPDLDKLLLQQRSEVDPNKRKQVLRQTVQRITDQSWAFSLYYATRYAFWTPNLKNFNVNWATTVPYFRESWLAQ